MKNTETLKPGKVSHIEKQLFKHCRTNLKNNGFQNTVCGEIIPTITGPSKRKTGLNHANSGSLLAPLTKLVPQALGNLRLCKQFPPW